MTSTRESISSMSSNKKSKTTVVEKQSTPFKTFVGVSVCTLASSLTLHKSYSGLQFNKVGGVSNSLHFFSCRYTSHTYPSLHNILKKIFQKRSSHFVALHLTRSHRLTHRDYERRRRLERTILYVFLYFFCCCRDTSHTYPLFTKKKSSKKIITFRSSSSHQLTHTRSPRLRETTTARAHDSFLDYQTHTNTKQQVLGVLGFLLCCRICSIMYPQMWSRSCCRTECSIISRTIGESIR